VSDRV